MRRSAATGLASKEKPGDPRGLQSPSLSQAQNQVTDYFTFDRHPDPTQCGFCSDHMHLQDQRITLSPETDVGANFKRCPELESKKRARWRGNIVERDPSDRLRGQVRRLDNNEWIAHFYG